ncbi:MAG TPA: BTAD domain-containing putative transcriptional regulator [Candidatus Limnocylindrales bacterium]|nr:BTAD domain-containing putative transcriptional regulator [Candidatus Limnocylindrales bacterium]
MRFGVLGPLHVEGDRGPLAVAGQKERTLLALLLTRAGGTVPTDALIDGLWGEDPPATAAKSLQAHVVRLRDALEPDRPRGTPGSLIVTHGSGYELATEPETIDARRFERLAADGRRALAAGAVGTAGRLFAAALELWRGEPYDGFDARVLRDEAERLERLRRVVIDDRTEADLAAGRHRALVPDLEARVAADPFDERAWSRLMLAHYRSAHQAEALAVYHRARTILSDELGVEPGPELEEMQRRILTQDPELARVAGHLPGRLPPPLAEGADRFVGRDPELATLRAWWDRILGGAAACGRIWGAPGIGRTRLAGELARRIAGNSAILYASAEPPSTDQLAILARLASGIDREDLIGGSDPPEVIGARLGDAIARLAADDPLLVVLDDLDVDSVSVGSAVRALAERLANRRALVLLVSDSPAPPVDVLPDAGAVELRPLDASAVTMIAAAYAGDDDAELAAADIAVRTGGVPATIHAEALAWAQRRARERVGAAAARAATEREALRGARRTLTAGIATWQDLVGGHATSRGAAPYKGLARFEEADASLFFGREALVGQLVARTAEEPFLGIVGPSGSGKSSLARAGLLASLAGGVLPGSDRWQRRIVVPDAEPLALLDGVEPGAPAGERTVLIVDQLETLFSACRDAERRRGFLDRLVELATATDPVAVIVTLRADHFGHVVESPSFAGLLGDATVPVSPMTADEVHRAIELPARRTGVAFEPGLVAAIAADVAGRPGALPLLSTALLELWERRRGGVLTWAGYREAGGVRGAVARLAEDAFGALDEGDRAIARRILVRTAGAPTGTDDEVGRRVPLDELSSEGEAGRRVLGALAERRLMTIDGGAAEVAHEALFREWPRLRTWLDEDRAGREIHAHLITAAGDWAARGREPTDLYRGARLAAASEWADAHPDELNELERAFIDAGRAAAERDALEAAERAARTARQNRRLRLAAFGLTAALAVALGAGALAIRQSDAARREAIAADAARLGAVSLAEPTLDRSLLLAAAAYRLDGSLDTRSALLAAVQRSPEAIRVLRANADERLIDIAISPDGRVVAMSTNAGAIHLWDWEDAERLSTVVVDGDNSFHIGFAGDDTLLALDNGGRIHGWQVPSGDPLLARPTGLGVAGDGSALAVAFVPGSDDVVLGTVDGLVVRVGADGSVSTIAELDELTGTLARAPSGDRIAADVGGTVVVVDDGGTTISRIDEATAIDRMAFSPDGRLLALGLADGAVRLVAATSGAEVARVDLHGQAIKDLAFTPDGSRIVGVADDGGVAAWDPDTGFVRRFTGGHDGRVFAVALTSDGHRMVTAGTDGTGVVWDLADERSFGRRLLSYPPKTSWFAPSPDGSRVAASHWTGDVTLIDLTSGRTRSVQPGIGPLGVIAWSTDGTVIGVAGEDGVIGLLDGSTLEPVGDPIEADVGAIGWIAFAPDGGGIAISSMEGVHALDLDGGPPVTGLWPGVIGNAVSFNAAGTVLAAGAVDGWLRTWAWPSLEPGLNVQAAETETFSVAFDARGRRMITAHPDGSARLWDAGSGTMTAELRGHATFVFDARFSPDGRTIISAGLDGGVVLWDASSLRQVGRQIPSPVGGPALAWLSPDGSEIVSARLDQHEVWTWPAEADAWLRHACSVAGRDLTEDEWSRYLPARPYEPTCPG